MESKLPYPLVSLKMGKMIAKFNISAAFGQHWHLKVARCPGLFEFKLWVVTMPDLRVLLG